MAGCQSAVTESSPLSTAAESPQRFAAEVDFLRLHGEVIVLQAGSEGVVAVSPQYQGRVMTSAVHPDSIGFGWINHDFIRSGQTGTPFDNYGGEDRFWLGPEGGQFALYFESGSRFSLDDWKVPSSMQEGEWTVSAQSDTSVAFSRLIDVTSFSGTRFSLAVERTIRLLSATELAAQLQAGNPLASAHWVAYETVNQVTNRGREAWKSETGLLSVWILGMFRPFDGTWVVLPYRGSAKDGVVNDRYFGDVPPDRIAVRDGYVLFRADGRYRSKIGIGPAHAKPVMGSYTPSRNLLTIVQFNLPSGERGYVNSMWEIQDDPYDGDVVNSYNDGPPNPGGFYELESSSPALALGPGERFIHIHRTVHLTAPIETLDSLALPLLGVSLREVARGLPQSEHEAGAGSP
jgi:hypothetical protein